MSLGEMAYAVLYTLHLTLALLFQQKKQVLEPIKMSHGHLKSQGSQCHQGTQPRGCFDSFPLAYFACCKPPGQISFIYLVTEEPHQISMSSLLTGKLGHRSSCQLAVLIYLLPLQQILAPLMSSCGYTTAFCRKDGEKATSHRNGLLTKLSSQIPCRHATGMRIFCGGVVCVEASSLTVFGFWQPAGPPETGFEPRCGRGIIFQNSRILLNAGRRACKPAATN